MILVTILFVHVILEGRVAQRWVFWGFLWGFYWEMECMFTEGWNAGPLALVYLLLCSIPWTCRFHQLSKMRM